MRSDYSKQLVAQLIEATVLRDRLEVPKCSLPKASCDEPQIAVCHIWQPDLLTPQCSL